jgi:uncharacterized protein
MIEPELLAILCCPETRQPVRLAAPAEIVEINQRIASGSARTRAGNVVSEIIEGGLVRQDGAVVYAIRHGIPIMLAEEAIPLPR